MSSMGENQIAALGLHWQSLIVSPEQQAWMAPSKIDDAERYGWWERLRSVGFPGSAARAKASGSWYYDGPTRASSPVQANVKGHILDFHFPDSARCRRRARNRYPGRRQPARCPLVSQTAGPDSAKRQGLYIEVANGLAQARVVPVAEGKSNVNLQAIAPTTAAAAQGRFLAMLTDYGLTSEEAAGLADVWKPQFWQTPGKRLLVILAAKDYDAMCSLRVRPKPTEVVRLGVLLTEF